MKNPHIGLKRLISASSYSLAGIQYAYRHEASFRQEIWLCIMACPWIFVLSQNIYDAFFLGFSLLFVLVTELLNSAIEAIVDKTTPEIHPLAKAAKDMGSAAVTTSIGFMICVWGYFIVQFLIR